METINWKGHFVYNLSALAAGDCKADFKQSEKILETLVVLEVSGFARRSRKGWMTASHPDLGTVQWKSGTDFRTVGSFFFLRLNGELILKAWPKAGDRNTGVEWVAKAAQNLPIYERREVERQLGVI